MYLRVFMIAILATFQFGILSPLKAQDRSIETASNVSNVFENFCHRCHNGATSSSGESFDIVDYNQLVAKDGPKLLITANDLNKSIIWTKVGKKKDMPEEGSPEAAKFTDLEREVIRKWIEGGAPPFGSQVKKVEPISLQQMLKAIYEDLLKSDRDDRPYRRYFTLSHLNNDPKITNELMPIYRAALSKAINSLSWKPRIVLPRPVDARETVYVVDIRDMDWDRNHKWLAIQAEYPYGLSFPDNDSQDVRRLDEDIRDLTGCQIPTIRGDWFIMNATRPPLYHILLGIPTNAKMLEQQLGVDIPSNFKRQRLARAAFTKGGVSEQNREIERHDALYGAYWKSYDFLNQAERGKRNEDPAKAILVRFPLGPRFEGHPYPELAFEQDGGEIIFNLPNRLQAYMLVNAKDERIDSGPIEVVSDSKKVSGTNVIVNGLSCMVCHDRGMKYKDDELRANVNLGGAPRKFVDKLHPPPVEMTALMKGDEEAFLAALDKAISPFLRVGVNSNKNVEELPEPINIVAQNYNAPLNLDRLATELYLTSSMELQIALGQQGMRDLGIVNRPVARDEWERGSGRNLFHKSALKGAIGVPILFFYQPRGNQ